MPELRIPVTEMRRYLPGDFNRLTIRANSPVQGAGAAILKCALGTLWKHLENTDEAKICAAVHDELILLGAGGACGKVEGAVEEGDGVGGGEVVG